MNNYLLDAHVHFQDISDDMLQSALLGVSAGFSRYRSFCCSVIQSDWGVLDALASAELSIFPFFGIHPWNSATAGFDFIQTLERHLRRVPSGVGEIGLDGLRGPDMETQVSVLKSQLALALDMRRPFVLHCVKAWGQLRDVLASFDLHSLPFIMHGFSGSFEELRYYLNMGAYISLGPRNLQNINEKTIRIIKEIPAERILLETDYPYLPGVKGSDSASEYLSTLLNVTKTIAAIKGRPPEELMFYNWNNGEVIINFIND